MLLSQYNYQVNRYMSLESLTYKVNGALMDVDVFFRIFVKSSKN